MCSSFAICNQVRHVIERITSRQASKLKVAVMHRDVVAHQTFALRLLTWLQKIVSLNEGLFLYLFILILNVFQARNGDISLFSFLVYIFY